MPPLERLTWSTLGLLIATTAAARGDVWEDPGMAEAVARAEVIVRARAPAEGASGEPRVAFRVEEVLKGRLATPSVEVGGLHDPTRGDGPVFRPDEAVYLVLERGEDGRLDVPTPTMGRFPVRDGDVHYVALRDTYLRVTLPAADFEAYVGLLLGRRDEGWLTGLRTHLAAGAPADEGPARMRHYLALESLVRAGRPADAEAVVRYLDPEAAPFQMRVSAGRALAACAGGRAAGRLLTVARADPEPAVRTTAIRCIAALPEPPAEAVDRLLALFADATTEPVRFSGPTDPRLNAWPSPKVALLQAVARIGAAPARERLLTELGEDHRLEVYAAVLRTLLSLEDDTELAADLVARFRSPADEAAELYNQELCAALTRLTGAEHGLDVAAWRAAYGSGD